MALAGGEDQRRDALRVGGVRRHALAQQRLHRLGVAAGGGGQQGLEARLVHLGDRLVDELAQAQEVGDDALLVRREAEAVLAAAGCS